MELKTMQITYREIRATIPEHLFRKSSTKGLYYAARDALSVFALYYIASRCMSNNPNMLASQRGMIEAWVSQFPGSSVMMGIAFFLVKWTAWATYWLAQSICMAACWCLAHEAGHGNVSPKRWVNHSVGFIFHSCLLTPYYSWRITHHTHHKAVALLEKDENYVPRTRSDRGLSHLQPTDPPSPSNPSLITERRGLDGVIIQGSGKTKQDPQRPSYHDIFDETPLYTLGRMLAMQLVGFQHYLLFNTLGCRSDPPGTNHFAPSSVLFKPNDRNYYRIVSSNIGIGFVFATLVAYAYTAGFATLWKVYLVPYLLTHHWIVMLTYLHHSDPTIPHYRSPAWNFVRGSLATVDRPLLGWVGRFWFHNVSHDHVGHHLFTTIPFYNQPAVTEILKSVLPKEDYNYDSTNSFYALYRTFKQCCFVEDSGDIVMYKNGEGKSAREVSSSKMVPGGSLAVPAILERLIDE
ncbi:delta-12 fatty acid desaturase [Collybia nuda]|uniref:Delta-12 fatty acid desaturase n=1 Tax=Collybia nuda TaxID=64659 RepID=A0A9P5XVM6_9AGAR|nr:delta-12 fatty acid desaturase [Collybia nuda]